MTEVAYSREAMRALFMLDAGERGRAIETIEKLANAYDALCDERDIAAAAGKGETEDAETDDTQSQVAQPTAGDTAASAEKIEAKPDPDAIKIPGTLPLGTSGNFCLAPFSQSGDFVVALDENITVVSLIDVIDGLNEVSSE